VRTDLTTDGYILDRGFAVFVEDYPASRKLLDYGALDLRRFEPGALVGLRLRRDGDGDGDGGHYFASLSDPLRRPRNALSAVFSPICGPLDKLRLVPLFLNVLAKSEGGLFDEDEIDARTCLRGTYGLSDEFVNAFFAPFVEGIFLAPLEEVSSRMLHFIVKMFAGGYASLPRGGMRAIVDQLRDRAFRTGIDVRLESRAVSIMEGAATEEREIVASCGGRAAGGGGGGGGGRFVVRVDSREYGTTTRTVRARSVIIATDVGAANGLLVGTDGLIGGSGGVSTEGSSSRPPPREEGLLSSPPPRRSVGCLYYGFASPSPVLDPMLILNGEGGREPSRRNTGEYPINNVCFPSRVQDGHAPDGRDLCCVSVLEKALAEHGDDVDSLDAAVRVQLATWFPERASDIIDESRWERKGAYVIHNAQPANYRSGGADDVVSGGCANVHGGRDCSTFRGVPLPAGMYVCGDHMATATLNGALESGVNAGDAAARFVQSGMRHRAGPGGRMTGRSTRV
jgi:hypothetical protein